MNIGKKQKQDKGLQNAKKKLNGNVSKPCVK